jgi:TonB family protein
MLKSNDFLLTIVLLLMCFGFGYTQQDVNGKDSPFLTSDGEMILVTPDIAPEFKGGLKAFMFYVQNNLKYPASARKSRIEGVVYVSFVVSKTGEVKDVVVIKGISPECDEAARQVVVRSPAWVPALRDGEPVNARMVVPIKYTVAKNTSDKMEDQYSSLSPENIDWNEGSILLSDGRELKGNLKYNDKNGVLMYQNGSGSDSFTPRSAAGFEFWDGAAGKQRVFFTFPYADKAVTKHFFFEVIKEFKSFAVLAKTDPIDLDERSTPGSIYDSKTNTFSDISLTTFSTQVSQSETIYLMDAKDGAIKPYVKIVDKDIDDTYSVKTRNWMIDEDLLKIYTGTLYQKLLAYAEENKLRFSRKWDLIRILEYYSSLLE